MQVILILQPQMVEHKQIHWFPFHPNKFQENEKKNPIPHPYPPIVEHVKYT